MKINLFKHLSKKEQDDIYKIVADLKTRVKSGNLSKKEAFNATKNGKDVNEWINSVEKIEDFYGELIPHLHKKLLTGYKKIIEPFVKEGVLIASNAGTQLGVIRDSSLIPWDDDIDLVMDIRDFNKYKHKIRSRALRNGWFMWTRNWINNKNEVIKKSDQIQIQLFSIRGFKLDFGHFIVNYRPWIDIFPAIRVNEKISKTNRNKISYTLSKLYDSIDPESNITNRLLRNKKIEYESPEYFQMLKSSQEEEKNIIEIKDDLKKIVDKNYYDNSDTLMQLHPATPVFSNFKYVNMEKKIIKMYGNEFEFIVSDNFSEQFLKEYGPNWEQPIKTHIHLILIWFIRFKK